MPTTKPKKMTLRAYQVGFGDCFLLTFHYPGTTGDRNILIDFGSTRLNPKAPANQMERIANDIKKNCASGRLDAVVATHRHKDHISGFATNANGTASGDIIASLKPKVVIQPWTEHPDAAPNAKTAPTTWSNKQAYVASLASMNAFAAQLPLEIPKLRGAVGAQRLKELSYLGETNLANKSAVDNLMNMGERNVYVHYRSKSGLDKLLPGVTVTVLGPPTLEQTKSIEKQRSRDEAEYWHFQATALNKFGPTGQSPFRRARIANRKPPHTRWLAKRIDSVRGNQLLQIVRALDDAMNNTSVILLFEIGKQKFLFPGDAQIENWSYALRDAPDAQKNRDLLEEVDLYKVGHHGSLNATPKSLWKLFKQKKSAHPTEDTLTSVVSTLKGVHGSSQRHTEVPRTKLVSELERESTFYTTEKMNGNLCHVIEINL